MTRTFFQESWAAGGIIGLWAWPTLGFYNGVKGSKRWRQAVSISSKELNLDSWKQILDLASELEESLK